MNIHMHCFVAPVDRDLWTALRRRGRVLFLRRSTVHMPMPAPTTHICVAFGGVLHSFQVCASTTRRCHRPTAFANQRVSAALICTSLVRTPSTQHAHLRRSTHRRPQDRGSHRDPPSFAQRRRWMSTMKNLFARRWHAARWWRVGCKSQQVRRCVFRFTLGTWSQACFSLASAYGSGLRAG